MPLYEFTCPECAERFEKLVRSSTAIAEVRCPTCGSDRVERLMSAFATGGARSSSSSSSSSASCGPVG